MTTMVGSDRLDGAVPGDGGLRAGCYTDHTDHTDHTDYPYNSNYSDYPDRDTCTGRSG